MNNSRTSASFSPWNVEVPLPLHWLGDLPKMMGEISEEESYSSDMSSFSSPVIYAGEASWTWKEPGRCYAFLWVETQWQSPSVPPFLCLHGTVLRFPLKEASCTSLGRSFGKSRAGEVGQREQQVQHIHSIGIFQYNSAYCPPDMVLFHESELPCIFQNSGIH